MDTPMTEPPPTEQRPPDPPRDWWSELYRSRRDRLVGGVAAGLADTLSLPVLLVRVGIVLLGLVGIGVPLYVLAWALLPDEYGDRVTGHGPVRDLVVVGAVVVAGLMLFAAFPAVDYFGVLGRAFPWFLLLLGVALVLRRVDSGQRRATPPPVPPSTSPVSVSEVPPPPIGYRYTPTAESAVVTAPRPIPTPRPPSEPRPTPFVGPVTWCVALVALGIMGLAAGRTSGIGPGAMAAVVMIVFGVGLTVSAFRGRARGLLLPALAVGLGLAGLASLGIRADSVARPFDITVRNQSELRSQYAAGAGTSTLDLAELELTADRTIRVSETAGRIEIVLPREVATYTTVAIGLGDLELQRPSGNNSLWIPELQRAWADGGAPDHGDAVSDAELALVRSSQVSSTWSETNRDGEIVTGPVGSGHRLDIDIDLGVGNVTLIDPHWTDVPTEITEPTQLCTVAGGERGVVSPCSEVPEGERVAVCFGVDDTAVVDCRESSDLVNGMTPSPVCRGFAGEEVLCMDVGINPVGLPPVPTVPEVPEPGIEETTEPVESSIAPSATAPSATVAPAPTVAPIGG